MDDERLDLLEEEIDLLKQKNIGKWLYRERNSGGFEEVSVNERDIDGNIIRIHTEIKDCRYKWNQPYCSKCGIGQENESNYCPNCGAKMEEELNESI